MSTKGGEVPVRGVMGYDPPKGPKGIDNSGVGLGGHNCGKAGVQGPYESTGDGSSGSVGLGGTNHGNKGTQHS